MVSWEQLLIAPGSSGSVCSCRLSQATQSWARAHMAWKAPGHIEGLWMRRLIDLFHLTSAKRTKWGCVTCMLMPVVPSPPLPEPNPRGGETTVHAKGNSPPPPEMPDASAGPSHYPKRKPALQKASVPKPSRTSVSPGGTWLYLCLPQNNTLLVTLGFQDGPTFKDMFFSSFKVACFLT